MHFLLAVNGDGPFVSVPVFISKQKDRPLDTLCVQSVRRTVPLTPPLFQSRIGSILRVIFDAHPLSFFEIGPGV